MVRTAALACLLLTGCGDGDALDACEAQIAEKLRSPSTYRLIESDIVRRDDKWWLLIDYDADNAFGTPIRAKAVCTVPIVNGAPAINAVHLVGF